MSDPALHAESLEQLWLAGFESLADQDSTPISANELDAESTNEPVPLGWGS